MESPDLNHPSSSSGDELDALLRRQARLPTLPDEGFSLRVMAELPRPAPSRNRLRAVCCSIGALSGAAVAWFKTAPSLSSGEELAMFEQTLTELGRQLSSPALLSALLVAGISLIVAFWSHLAPSRRQ